MQTDTGDSAAQTAPAEREGCWRWVALGVLAGFCFLILMLLAADVAYLVRWKIAPARIAAILAGEKIRAALQLSLLTSFTTLVLVCLTGIPIGYALSRFRFPGRALTNTLVDVPIFLPPVVIGLSLLAFFGSDPGQAIKTALERYGVRLVSGVGIVLCQFLMAVPYAIRTMKAAFDSTSRSLEHVALSLGCTPWQAFRRVTLPLARNGLIAGGIMAWARAIGVFGPLVVFVGTAPGVQVLPTTMWLELNVGNIEAALVVALFTTLLAGAALVAVHVLVPGRTWT